MKCSMPSLPLILMTSLLFVPGLPAQVVSGTVALASFPSVGPNNSLSPSWPKYTANALTVIQASGGNVGNPIIDPTAYAIASGLNPGDLILSAFSSWEGVAGPTGPFAGEYGNQLLFGLAIMGNGNYFRLSNLYNTMSSSDSGNSLSGNSGGFSAYGPYLVGIDCGPDKICGTADDTVYQSGEDASLPVNELFYVGVGAAFDATSEPGATNQDKLDSVRSFIFLNIPFSVSNTYTLYADDGATVLGSSAATLSVQASQTITFSALVDRVFGSGSFVVSATATSGLGVSFTSMTPLVCSVWNSTTVNLLSGGTCTIEATQAGNALYAAAAAVAESFQVLQASQTIAFSPLSDLPLGTPAFYIGATASSGLAVGFASLTNGNCTVSGSMVALKAYGTCTIEATQAGNSSYLAAPPVDQSFEVVDACSVNQVGGAAVADVQGIVNEALGLVPATNDLNGDGRVNVADVQIVVNDALGLGCAFNRNTPSVKAGKRSRR